MPIFKEFTKKLLLRITKFLGLWCTHKPNLVVIQLWWTRNYYLSLWCILNPNLAVKQLWWTHSYHLSIGCDAVITPTWLWCSYDELIIIINTRQITIIIVSTITKPLVELKHPNKITKPLLLLKYQEKLSPIHDAVIINTWTSYSLCLWISLYLLVKAKLS